MWRAGWAPPQAIERRSGLALVVACFVWAAGSVMATRGIWYDEIWSVYVTRHDVGFTAALRTRWLTDNHPPTFYALTWLAEPIVGDTIGARRALNFLALAAAGGTLWGIGRRRADLVPFMLLLVVMLLASGEMMTATIDHRAYALQLCANTVLASVLFAIITAQGDYTCADRWLLATTALTLLLSFNLHFISALISGCIAGIVAIALWPIGRRQWSGRLLAASMLAALPLAATWAVQRRLLADTAAHFWATTTSGYARKLLSRMAKGTLLWNPIATGAGLYTLIQADRTSPVRRFAIIMLVACLVACAALYLANMARPFIVARYLLALKPFLLAILAALSATTILQHRLWWWGTVVIAAAMLVYGALKVPVQRNWDDSAARIASIVAACPDTIVQARGHWIASDAPHLMANEATIVRFGYERLAREHGFRIEPAGSSRMSSRCPTLLWIEHLSVPIAKTDALIRAAALPASPDATLWRGETGVVVTLPPR